MLRLYANALLHCKTLYEYNNTVQCMANCGALTEAETALLVDLYLHLTDR